MQTTENLGLELQEVGDFADIEKLNENFEKLDDEVPKKMEKNNPTGTGAFSMNRKAGTDVGDYSHAEGFNCEASGECAHAEGSDTEAIGYYSHAEGLGTTAGFCCHTEGKYNKIDPTLERYAHVTGGGEDDNNRKNIYTLDWYGNCRFAGDIIAESACEWGVNESPMSVRLSEATFIKECERVTTSSSSQCEVIMIGKKEGVNPENTDYAFVGGMVFGSIVSSTYTGVVTISNLPTSRVAYAVKVTNSSTGEVKGYFVDKNKNSFQVALPDDGTKCVIEFSYYGVISYDEFKSR